MKKTKTGPSTDADSLQKMAQDHPIVEVLLRYREVEKLRSTYGEGLLVLGRVELAQKRTAQSVEAFRQAVAIFADPSLDSRDMSKRYEAHESLGDALSASGLVGQAQDDDVHAVEQGPPRRLILTLGRIDRHKRQIAAALQPLANLQACGAGLAVDEDFRHQG